MYGGGGGGGLGEETSSEMCFHDMVMSVVLAETSRAAHLWNYAMDTAPLPYIQF